MSTTWKEQKAARKARRARLRETATHHPHRFEKVGGWNGCHKCGDLPDSPQHTLVAPRRRAS